MALNWISVETMPPELFRVVVIDKDSAMVGATVVGGEWVFDIEKEGYAPTHWMPPFPLPK